MQGIAPRVFLLRTGGSAADRVFGRPIPNKRLCKHEAWRNWAKNRDFPNQPLLASTFPRVAAFVTGFRECMERGVRVFEFRSSGPAPDAPFESAWVCWPREWHNAVTSDDLVLFRSLFPRKKPATRKRTATSLASSSDRDGERTADAPPAKRQKTAAAVSAAVSTQGIETEGVLADILASMDFSVLLAEAADLESSTVTSPSAASTESGSEFAGDARVPCVRDLMAFSANAPGDDSEYVDLDDGFPWSVLPIINNNNNNNGSGNIASKAPRATEAVTAFAPTAPAAIVPVVSPSALAAPVDPFDLGGGASLSLAGSSGTFLDWPAAALAPLGPSDWTNGF